MERSYVVLSFQTFWNHAFALTSCRLTPSLKKPIDISKINVLDLLFCSFEVYPNDFNNTLFFHFIYQLLKVARFTACNTVEFFPKLIKGHKFILPLVSFLVVLGKMKRNWMLVESLILQCTHLFGCFVNLELVNAFDAKRFFFRDSFCREFADFFFAPWTNFHLSSRCHF